MAVSLAVVVVESERNQRGGSISTDLKMGK